MTTTLSRPDVFDDLPEGLGAELDQFNKEAGQVPVALLLSLLVPLFLLLTAAWGIVRVFQTRSLTREYPQLEDPRSRFPGATRRELKKLGREHANLQRVLKFAEARTSFMVAAVLPFALAAGLALVFVVIV